MVRNSTVLCGEYLTFLNNRLDSHDRSNLPAFVQMKNRKEEINDVTQPILFTKHRVTKRPEDFADSADSKD